MLADIRDRGYGAWRFDDAHTGLHERLTAVLASVESGERIAHRLTSLMTMVTLTSVTHTLEKDLASAEFVVLPIFGADGQPRYQIEVRLANSGDLTLPGLNEAVDAAQRRLASLAG